MALSHLTRAQLIDMVEELQKKNEKLELLTKGKDVTIDRLAKLNDEIEKDIGTQGKRIEELEDTIQNMNKAHDRQVEYIHELEEIVIAREKTIEKYYMKNDELKSVCDNFAERVRELEKHNSDCINGANNRQASTIRELMEEIENLREDNCEFEIRIRTLVAENERFINENDKLQKKFNCINGANNRQANTIRAFKEENSTLHEYIEELEKRLLDREVTVADLTRKLEEKEYVDTDIASINSIAEAFKTAANSAVAAGCKLKLALNSLYGDPYKAYANHIAAKVKALEDAGLSHDDAMGLIPLWDDET